MIVNSPEYRRLRGHLGQCELFSPCTEGELSSLLHASYSRRISRGKNVFESGDFARDVYLLLEGGVKLCSEVDGTRAKVLQIVYPMELFGLFDILTDGHRDLGAYTIATSDLLVIDADAFLALLRSNAPFALGILKGWGDRFREFSSWCFRFNHYGAREKVAAYLVNENGKREADELHQVQPTRRDIASLLGITPETLSRELSFFRRQGWIDVASGGELRVADCDSLRGLIGS